jgi:heptosyltransferase-2/heptosyltransferase-3
MNAPFSPLVVRFGAFGDMILIVPMLKALTARYGRPCDVVSSGGWTPPLLQRVPAAGRMVLLTSRRTPFWFNRSQREFVTWLRPRPPGPVYVFETDDKCDWLLARAGVRPEWICSLRDLPRLPGEHIMQHALRLARETPAALRVPGAETAPAAPFDASVVLRPDDRRDCQAWLERMHVAGSPLVLIQPGNKRTMRWGPRTRRTNFKYWPEKNWAEVIAAVRREMPASRVLICGAPAERPLAEEIRRRCAVDGVHVATADLPIPRLLALQEQAHSMISVDTGPAHAAAAMGCPLVVLFARIDPQLYAPIPTTAPVKIIAPPPDQDGAPMTAIPPATVLDAWRGLARR